VAIVVNKSVNLDTNESIIGKAAKERALDFDVSRIVPRYENIF
jgi:hypothetical protein